MERGKAFSYKTYGIAKKEQFFEVYAMYNPHTDVVRWTNDFAMADVFNETEADAILKKEPTAYKF